jgi:hypothetical protein
MSVFGFAKRCGALIGAAALCGSTSWAQAQPAPSSAGPGRIICRAANSCDLGIGTPPSIRYKIDASALPDADKTRLVKQCTAKATPCVATVTGADAKGVIKAASITFYN